MRENLELLYFVSGIVVAGAACVGLYQLVLTKDAATSNAKREAFKIAAQQCEFYLTRVVPLLNALHVAATKQGITSFGKASVTLKDGVLKGTSHQPPDLTAKCIAIAEPLIAAMNALESFAVHFTNGVAADAPGFACVGRSFCSSVEDVLPELVPLARGGYYTNTVKLFAIWNNRLEKSQVDQERIMLDRKSKDIQDIEIKIIGA